MAKSPPTFANKISIYAVCSRRFDGLVSGGNGMKGKASDPANFQLEYNAYIDSKVASAKQADSWIYDPSHKYWYTPDEFAKKFKDRWDFNKSELWFESLQIRNPMDGLRAGFKQLEDMRKKLELFSEKAFMYYRQKS